MSFVGRMRNAKQWVEHATSVTKTDAQKVCLTFFSMYEFLKQGLFCTVRLCLLIFTEDLADYFDEICFIDNECQEKQEVCL